MHTEFNHPPNIIKHITAAIENCLLNRFSTEILFKESTKHYNDKLRQSGYDKILTYKQIDTNHQKHSKHKRKIKWFNLLFSQYLSKNIGKSFLTLSDLHFFKEPHL